MDLFSEIPTRINVVCDYCGQPAKLVTGRKLFPRRPDLAHRRYWSCQLCSAYVGCAADHDSLPVGRLANAELRAAQRIARAAFDPLWRDYGMTRTGAADWLAEQLGMPAAECQIGLFDLDACHSTIQLCNELKIELNSTGVN